MSGGPAVVTGATGCLGRWLVRSLLERGREVTALCRDPEALADLAHPRLRGVAWTAERPETAADCLRPGVSLFHLAAARGPSAATAEACRRINLEGAERLGRLAAAARVGRLVYVSSALVYGPSGGRPVDEAQPLAPREGESPYLASRRQAVEALRRLAAEGLPLVTACPTIVFGPDHARHPNLVTDQVRRLLRLGLDLTIGPGDRRRSLAFVGDVAEGLLLAEARGRVGTAYILGGEDLSHREFNRAVLALAGRRARLRGSLPPGLALAAARGLDRVRPRGAPGSRQAAVQSLLQEWRYDSGRARRELGYAPRTFAEGMGETLRFLGRAPRREL